MISVLLILVVTAVATALGIRLGCAAERLVARRHAADLPDDDLRPEPAGTRHAEDHRRTIADALEDWWLTTDPAMPFDYDQVAEHVDRHLTHAGYRITTGTRTNSPNPQQPRRRRPTNA
ncbi:hypothetical protein [Streptomyces sp. NPDC127105]|uniref:hypothetical protein n=1 Tax=Streptomyces sp. NPDC127105 TaxID=3345359 RepID=UPI00365DB2AD